jgi:rod shape-determining protein MreC
MEYSPPPLFKQGASARAKVVFFSFVAIALLIGDSHLRSLTLVRQVVGSALYPLQMAALAPRDAFNHVGDYFSAQSTVQAENARLNREKTINAQLLQQGQQLSAENAQLRKLLGASDRLPVKSLMSEILYDARDPFTRKIILDRGSQNGVAPGQPVIDDIGVVGQVTRVFPFTSEITLLTDKDQAISVQVVRNGLRSVAYGRGQSGVLDLKFMAANADIKKDDVLVTSGIDDVFPAGLQVAKVVQVESKSSDAFAHIVCQPSAGIDRNKQLLILLVEPKAPRPDAEDSGKDKKDKSGKRHLDSAKEAESQSSPTVPTKPGDAKSPEAKPVDPKAPVIKAPENKAPENKAAAGKADAKPADGKAAAKAPEAKTAGATGKRSGGQ